MSYSILRASPVDRNLVACETIRSFQLLNLIYCPAMQANTDVTGVTSASLQQRHPRFPVCIVLKDLFGMSCYGNQDPQVYHEGHF